MFAAAALSSARRKTATAAANGVLKTPCRYEHQPAVSPVWMWDLNGAHLEHKYAGRWTSSAPVAPESTNFVFHTFVGLGLGLAGTIFWKKYQWNLEKQWAGYYDDLHKAAKKDSKSVKPLKFAEEKLNAAAAAKSDDE